MTMDKAPLITSTLSLTLDLPPSCIQFCPAHPDLFVVGTYNLERSDDEGSTEAAFTSEPKTSKPQSRNGSLLVFRLEGDDLVHVQTVVQPSAVLDIRFSPSDGEVLAVASSTATLGIYRLDPSANTTSPLQELAVSELGEAEPGTLFLQCQWYPGERTCVVASASNGQVYSLTLSAEWRISHVHTLSLESELEPWSVALSQPKRLENGSSCCTIYSGSDDSVLRYASYTLANNGQGIDSGVEDSSELEALHTAKLGRKHEAGVTAILPTSMTAPGGGRLVVTGSYDDHIRLFSIHDLDQTGGFPMVKVLAEENLGGGVWRLDPIKVEETRMQILASCMHAGARIVELSTADGSTWSCKVLARFEEHKSMNYGSDFVRGSEVGRLRCVSTSFYDRVMCVWDYEPK